VHDRRERGREFQIVGAAKKKERRPAEDLMDGTVSKSLSDERSVRDGLYGTNRECKYEGDL